jgi:hypothetical protein
LNTTPHSIATLAFALFGTAALAQPAPATPLDPNAVIDQFESTFGKFDGYRRSGAKGICAAGEFVGTAEARGLSTSSAFSGRPVPVIVRFSVGGANPKAPDNARSQRNLALQSTCPMATGGSSAISRPRSSVPRRLSSSSGAWRRCSPIRRPGCRMRPRSRRSRTPIPTC